MSPAGRAIPAHGFGARGRGAHRVPLAATLGALLALVAAPRPSRAHEFNPALLELRARADSPARYDVLWKTAESGEGSRAPALIPRLPARCREIAARSARPVPGGTLTRWSIDCGPGDPAGSVVGIDGLAISLTDALVRFTDATGEGPTVVLRGGASRTPWPARVRRASPTPALFRGYVRLGIGHVLAGVDHLLFVLALLLLTRTLGAAARTVTAFTVGHSVTLALATLGVLRVAQAPVEACIVLSIVLLAAELARTPARPTLTRRRPWLVAAVFGLLHGLGFAGALRELGLPAGEIPRALLGFNLGVEIGQLAAVAAATPVLLALRRTAWPPRARRVPAYALGAIASGWFIERVLAL